MAVLSFDRYKRLTGDTSSAETTVTSRVEDATALVEDLLRRPLEASERTEKLTVHRDGRAYPSATPIISISSPSTSAIDDSATIKSLDPDGGPPGFLDEVDWEPYHRPYGTVTYVGGWYARDSEDANATTDTILPATVERYLARLTRSLIGEANGAADRSNIVSASEGDVSVTYADALDDLDALVPGITRALRPWRRRAEP